MSDANLRYRSGVEFTYTEPNTYTSSGVGESTILATAFPLRMLLISPSFSLTYSRKNLNGSVSCPLAARALAERIPARSTLAVRILAPQHVFMISPILRRSIVALYPPRNVGVMRRRSRGHGA